MPKRKSKAPVHLNQSKRSLLTWNMNEGNQPETSTGCRAVPTASETFDDVACDRLSAAVLGGPASFKRGYSDRAAEQLTPSSEIQAPPHHITVSEYETIWEEASYSITVHEHRPQESVVGQLGLISLALSPRRPPEASDPGPGESSGRNRDCCPDRSVAAVGDALPKQFPGGRCSLFVSPRGPHHLVFDYAPDDVENAPGGLASDVYFCLGAAIVDEPPDACLDSLEKVVHHRKPKVKLVRRDYDAVTGQLSLAVCLLQPALTVPKFASEPTKKQDYAHHMQRLMHWFHGYRAPDPREDAAAGRHDFHPLFDAVRRRRHARNGGHGDLAAAVQLQHPSLVPTLREYQRQAVGWMLRKERFGPATKREGPGAAAAAAAGNGGRLHCLWSELKLADRTLYYNHHNGQFTRQRFVQPLPYPGGILADEMGLGKTVEVLACILVHPRCASRPASDQAREEPEGGSHPTRAVAGTGDRSAGSPREVVAATGISDAALSPSNARARVDSLEVGSLIAEQETDVQAEATSPGAVSEPMVESVEVTSEVHHPTYGNSANARTETQDVGSEGAEEETVAKAQSPVGVLEPKGEREGVLYQEPDGAAMKIPCQTDKEDTRVGVDKQDSGSRVAEEENVGNREEQTDQSVEGISQEGRDTELEIPQPAENGTGVHSDLSRNNSEPDVPQVPQETKAVHVEGLIPGTDSERASSVSSFDATNTSSEPTDQTAKLTAKSELTNTSYSLAAAATEAKPEQTDNCVKPEPVGWPASPVCKPSGSRQPAAQERAFELKSLRTAETELQDQGTRHPDEIGTDGLAVLNEGGPTIAKDVERTADGELPSDLATEATVGPETSSRPVGDANRPTKKPRKKQVPKRAPPNPYLRPKGREPAGFRFECVCGVVEEALDVEASVQCRECDGWQHSRCMNYSRPAPTDGRYLCPMCRIEQPAVPSGATLIISPATICHQWVDEINRHVQSQALNVLVYNGVKKHGFLQPRMLAKHDIVITTYETLRTELNYVDLPHSSSDSGRRLRHAKRYMAIPSPLPAVEWWRICLDEAQMVECPTAKVAEMALRLTAVNRWCVTGTPIQRDLDNLYGLFLFLGVEPYWVRCWWDSVLYRPYLRGNQEPMERVLAEVLWRSAKKDVIHQINIPAQTERIHWLQFSPVETHFYKRKREHCSADLLQAAGRLKVAAGTRLSCLARDTVHRLMNPLLRLRQACCHPQAVRGEFVRMQRTTLTMAELLASLTLKAKTESEEAHRQLVCSLNGLAAVCVIAGQTLDAIEHYRDVLRSAAEHRDRLETDSLQRLHAMHNLHQLVRLRPEGLVPTLRDGELERQMQEIRDAYLAKAEAALQSSFVGLRPLQEKIHELEDELSAQTPWWLEGLQWLRFVGVEDDFVHSIKDMLMSTTHTDSLSVANHFATLRGLQMVLATKLDDLGNAYKSLRVGMDQLSADVSPELVAEATDCHLRPFGGKPKNRCPLCQVHTLFTDYETRLFSIKQRDSVTDPDPDDDAADAAGTSGPRLRGSWAASEAERILRALLTSLRQHGADDDVLEEGGAHVEMMEVQKREFKSLRATWTMLCERVAAWDELKMATMRLRLREPHEPEEILAQANVIEPGQLDQQRLKLLNERALAQSELRKKLGQLVYLKSLAHAHSDLPDDGGNPEPCPICVKELGKQWSVLPCGHSFCNGCVDMMRAHRGAQRQTLRCAICRAAASLREISFVSTEKTDHELGSGITVKGGYSTKVEAVVRTLLQLRKQDANVKAIVFSTWVDVLTVVAKALKDNEVDFRTIDSRGKRHFKANLLDFKQEDGVTALLLPVNSGSKGLNIVEATHVLLIEPILNPASELQAVGRVHRIGQTRPTVVHRFLVRGTIEERLHVFLQANHTSDSLNNLEGETGALTLRNLKQLFSEDTGEPDYAASDDSLDLTDDEFV